MLHTRVAVALAVFALLPGCSSSSSNADGGAGGGSGGGSGSGSGGSSGGPSRTTESCAQAAKDANGAGTLASGSWGMVPAALQVTPSGGTFCGTVMSGDGGGLTGEIAIVLTSDWDQQIFDFYSPLAKTAGCTMEAMTTTTGAFASSGTSYTCTNGGYGRIDASPDANFLMLTYSATGL